MRWSCDISVDSAMAVLPASPERRPRCFLRRMDALKLLCEARPSDFETCRETEAACCAAAVNASQYKDYVRRAAFNLRENSKTDESVVYLEDRALTEGTLVGKIEIETKKRSARFERMLQEKYDALNDRKFEAIVRCRRCGK